jgi:phenylacetate-CoA ligase
MIGGQLVTPVSQRKPPFWVWNSALNQLYMSSYHLAPDLIPSYIKALEKYEIKYMLGYTSSLYSIAQEILKSGISILKMATCITNAEPLHDYQRQVISDAFQCDVRETYGMAEVVSAASECEFGTLHSWPDVGILETAEGSDVVKEKAGDFLCTGLLNTDMPLIRYRVGDRGFASEPSFSCKCGRSLPKQGPIEGRVDDVLYTFDGRRIGRLDPVFKTNLPIREAQIIQEALDRVRVRYVPEPHFTPQAGQSITERLQERMGAVQVILEPIDEIPRTANGKFRAVISQINSPESKQ